MVRREALAAAAAAHSVREAVLVMRSVGTLFRTERLPAAEIRDLAARKLARLLRAAGDLCGHLGEKQRAALRRVDEKTAFATLSECPPMTRQDVRRQFAEVRARVGPAAGRIGRTGGSTGEPLMVFLDERSTAMGLAALARGLRWAGVRPGDSGAFLTGSFAAGWPGRLRLAARNARVYPAQGPDVEVDRALDGMAAHPPAYVVGYVSALERYVERLLRRGIEIRPRAVLSTAETLLPAQRERFEAAFGCRVRDYYGSNEIGGIAFECERGTRHITAEHVFVEAAGGAPPGRPVHASSLLVTDLDNATFPLLRYENGDLGNISEGACACGRALPILASIDGRAAECLVSTSGERVPCLYFALRFMSLPGLAEYQVLQVERTRLLIRAVAGGEGFRDSCEAMTTALRERLGETILVEVEPVGRIERTGRGKKIAFRGMVPNDGRPRAV